MSTLVVGLLSWILGMTNALAESTDLPTLIERAKPSLVLVGTYGETDSPRFMFRGTGFVVEDGNLAVTNAHVLPDASSTDRDRRLVVQIRRGSAEWTTREARVIGLDKAHDVALLRFEGPAAPALTLAAANVAREGAAIALMGFPLGGALGFSTVTHRGIIASITAIALPPPSAQGLNERAIRQLREGSFDILQLDATAYPGNSGGPVFDVQSSTVVGIVNMVLVKGSKETALSHPSGITYAIPAFYISLLLNRR